MIRGLAALARWIRASRLVALVICFLFLLFYGVDVFFFFFFFFTVSRLLSRLPPLIHVVLCIVYFLCSRDVGVTIKAPWYRGKIRACATKDGRIP
jgi:hypothetical protein